MCPQRNWYKNPGQNVVLHKMYLLFETENKTKKRKTDESFHKLMSLYIEGCNTRVMKVDIDMDIGRWLVEAFVAQYK